MGLVAPIEAHGIIGDGRAAALVSSEGTIDWLCWPRFDSEAMLASLLHDRSAGEWRLRPAGEWRSTQRYVPETNVLRTEFLAPGGRVSVTDLMPVAGEEERHLLLPEHELVRIIDCVEGEALLETSLLLAPRFGMERVRLAQRSPGEVCVETRHGAFFARSERPLQGSGREASWRFTMRAGERVRFSLIWSPEGPAVLPPLREGCDAALERTSRFWRQWARQVRYDGPYRDAVLRSALALKLLQYPPSGALLAAATTSLPERLGGALNWDYRYCWLRDAAFTTRCLYDLGLRAEADAFVYWLMHSTQLTQPRLAVLYDVYGNSPRRERVLPGLSGYERSSPVRTGNAADRQHQLDLHGEVIDAICAHVAHGGTLDRESRRMLREFGDYIIGHWHLPDASLWEYRTAPEQHTHSKVLCWSALDGLLRLQGAGALPGLDAGATRAARERIALTVHDQAVDADSGAYVATLGGSEPDAALLLLPSTGFERASSLRMRSTLRTVLQRLGAGRGLLYRNARLRAEGDGAFLACSFWGVRCVAEGAGTLAEAERWLEALLGQASPLGLLAEELDPRSGRALGNFPQAFSHVGLISAALAIEERRSSERTRPARSCAEAPATMEVHT